MPVSVKWCGAKTTTQIYHTLGKSFNDSTVSSSLFLFLPQMDSCDKCLKNVPMGEWPIILTTQSSDKCPLVRRPVIPKMQNPLVQQYICQSLSPAAV